MEKEIKKRIQELADMQDYEPQKAELFQKKINILDELYSALYEDY